MIELLKILIGALILLLGIPLGIILAKQTKEELKEGQKWFKIIIIVGLIGGFISLLIQNDALMFSFFFIAIVTSQSIIRNKVD